MDHNKRASGASGCEERGGKKRIMGEKRGRAGRKGSGGMDLRKKRAGQGPNLEGNKAGWREYRGRRKPGQLFPQVTERPEHACANSAILL